jgi:hypothetical protein
MNIELSRKEIELIIEMVSKMSAPVLSPEASLMIHLHNKLSSYLSDPEKSNKVDNATN